MMSENSNVYYIPGVPQPVPVEAVTDLEVGSSVDGDIQEPQQPVWYRFQVEGNTPVTMTFQGPAPEYKLQSYKQSGEKGGTGNAHDGDGDDVITHTFAEPGPYTIFLAVASADQNNWPSRGYTISLSVGGNA